MDEIAPCGQVLCGAIVRVVKADLGAPSTDVHNPSGFVADGDRWKGTVHDPRSGRTYRAFIAVREGKSSR